MIKKLLLILTTIIMIVVFSISYSFSWKYNLLKNIIKTKNDITKTIKKWNIIISKMDKILLNFKNDEIKLKKLKYKVQIFNKKFETKASPKAKKIKLILKYIEYKTDWYLLTYLDKKNKILQTVAIPVKKDNISSWWWNWTNTQKVIKNCSNWIKHWETKIFYKISSVEYWKRCESQTRSCNDWKLSWNYLNTSCKVEWAKSCKNSKISKTFRWKTIYFNSSVLKDWESKDITNINWWWNSNFDGVLQKSNASCKNGIVNWWEVINHKCALNNYFGGWYLLAWEKIVRKHTSNNTINYNLSCSNDFEIIMNCDSWFIKNWELCKKDVTSNKEVKVMTYNIHYWLNKKFTNTGADSALDKMISYINKYNIDVAFIQEFPHWSKPSWWKLTWERKTYIKYVKDHIWNEYKIVEYVLRNWNKYNDWKSNLIITKFPIIKKDFWNLPEPLHNLTRKLIVLNLDIWNWKNLWVANTHAYYMMNDYNFNDLKYVLWKLDKLVPKNDKLIWWWDLNFDYKNDIKTSHPLNKLTNETNWVAKYKLVLDRWYKPSYLKCMTNNKYKNDTFFNTVVGSKRHLDYLFSRNIESCKNYWRWESEKSDHYAVVSTFIVK